MSRARSRDDPWYQELGLRIAEAIDRSGLPRNEIARRMGVTPGAVTNWAKGTAPEPHTWTKLARVLGVTGDYLLGTEAVTDSRRAAAVPDRGAAVVALTREFFLETRALADRFDARLVELEGKRSRRKSG